MAGYPLGNHIQLEQESGEEQQGDHIGGQQGVGHVQVGGKGRDEVRKDCGGQGRAGQWLVDMAGESGNARDPSSAI